MSDIKLFRTSPSGVVELPASRFDLERSLQTLIEAHLDAFFGIRFLASEYATGAKHRGRIDTLGLDENGCPVIVEYKRASNENIINQGLFYLDWLLSHRGEFQLLVGAQLGAEAAGAIAWDEPRVLCIAQDFTRYDEHAIEQIHRNVELVRYRRYGDDLLLFELVNESGTFAPVALPAAQRVASGVAGPAVPRARAAGPKTVSDYIDDADPELTDRYHALRDFCLSLGDDVKERVRQKYVAFVRLKNFACVEVHTRTRNVMVYLKVPPDSVDTTGDPMLRDVTHVGHYGTGALEVTIGSLDDLRRAEPLIRQSYEIS